MLRDNLHLMSGEGGDADTWSQPLIWIQLWALILWQKYWQRMILSKNPNPPSRIHKTQLLFSQLCCFFNTFRSHTVDDLVDVLESFASKCTPVCWFLCFLWLFTHQKSSVILPTSQIVAREHRISSTTAWMNIQACGECFDTKWICELGRSCNKIKVRLSGSSSFISAFHPTMCSLEQKIIQPL